MLPSQAMSLRNQHFTQVDASRLCATLLAFRTARALHRYIALGAGDIVSANAIGSVDRSREAALRCLVDAEGGGERPREDADDDADEAGVERHAEAGEQL